MRNTNTILNNLIAEVLPVAESWLRGVIRDEVRRTIEEERQKARPDVYLTRQETAKALKVSLPTLWKLSKEGKIKPTKIGRSVKFSESEIKRFQEEA